MAEPILVLLRGMGTGPEAWQPQVEAFGSSRRVLTPRLPLDTDFQIAAEAARIWQIADSTPIDACRRVPARRIPPPSGNPMSLRGSDRKKCCPSVVKSKSSVPVS